MVGKGTSSFIAEILSKRSSASESMEHTELASSSWETRRRLLFWDRSKASVARPIILLLSSLSISESIDRMRVNERPVEDGGDGDMMGWLWKTKRQEMRLEDFLASPF